MSKLLEGYYKAKDTFYSILRVSSTYKLTEKNKKFLKNENGKFTAMDAIDSEYPMKVEYGDFGEASEDIQKLSGMKNYNVKLTISFMKDGQEEREEELEEV